MAIQTLNTIKSWFRTSLKPTQQQFWDTWDSFRHKYDKIYTKEIEDLNQVINEIKIVKSGEFIIFKVAPNTENELEIGDSVIGYCEGNFLCEATYYGGDTSLMSSFTKPNTVVGRIVSFTTDSYSGDVITYELNDDVLLRYTSCGVYNGIYILYKKPGESEFTSFWPSGYYPQAWASWLELTPGTIIKLTDTLGDFEDSEEFIIQNVD